VEFCRPQGWRGKAFKLENTYESLTVFEILKEPFTGQVFPGYERINHKFAHLETIFKASKNDWKAAIESVKGVYLITDKSNNKRYVGSAYGDSGIWSRWACLPDYATSPISRQTRRARPSSASSQVMEKCDFWVPRATNPEVTLFLPQKDVDIYLRYVLGSSQSPAQVS
jgi:hypothetical protein